MSSLPSSFRARRRCIGPRRSSSRSKRSRSRRRAWSQAPAFAGFSGATRTLASNAAALFPVFEEPEVRAKKGLTSTVIAADLRKRLSVDPGRLHPSSFHRRPFLASAPAAALRCACRIVRAADRRLLASATNELVAAAQRDPRLVSVFSTFSANTPQVHVEIDRIRAKKLGVPIENVNAAVETYFGSAYVNDFNILGRTYRVTAQADLPFRRDTADLARLRTKNEAGEMVLLGSVMDFRDTAGPDRVPRYNLYPASEIQGETAPGTSSATALAHHEEPRRSGAAERLLVRMDRPVAAGIDRAATPAC